MFKVFVDASGHHKGSPLVTVAACVARPTEWKKFELAWRRTVKDAGLDSFHAKDNRSDPLRGPLLREVKKAKIPFAVVVSATTEEYAEATSLPFHSVMGGTLAACAFGCAHHVHNWTVGHGADACIYAFEEGDPGLNHILTVFNSLTITNPSNGFNVVKVAMIRKMEFPELAPSDFLSHVKSTNDGLWLNRWKQSCDVVDYRLRKKEMREASDEITKLIRINRARRKREGRALRGK